MTNTPGAGEWTSCGVVQNSTHKPYENQRAPLAKFAKHVGQ